MAPIFVISLKNASSRRKTIEKQLSELGIPFEWFDAVEGRLLTEQEIQNSCDVNAIRAAPHWLTRGALGCALSHYSVYKQILERSIPYAIILEDDVFVQKEFPHIVDLAIKQMRENEVMLLYTLSWLPLELSSSDKTDLDGKYALYGPAEINQPITASAYIISRAACETMVKAISPIRYAADSWGEFYKNKGYENLRCLYPFLIETLDSKSTIDYVQEGMLGRIMKAIDNYKVFPLYQLLRYRRGYIKNKMKKIKLVKKPSFKNAGI